MLFFASATNFNSCGINFENWFDRSKAVLLLWIFYIFSACVCYAFVGVCLYVPFGHLLGKGWHLCSRLWCLTVSLSLSHWYPGSGVVRCGTWLYRWLIFAPLPILTCSGLKLKSSYQNINFLIFQPNIYNGYLKELSHWDRSFVHPKHLLKLMGKKTSTILCSKISFV